MKEINLSNYRQVEIKTSGGKILSSPKEIDEFIKKIQSEFEFESLRPYLDYFKYRTQNGLVYFHKEAIILIESKIRNSHHVIHYLG